MASLIDAYLRLHQSLAADRFETVAGDALAIANATVKLGSRAASVRVAVNPFAQVRDVAAAREAFGGLSSAVIAFIGNAMSEGVAVAYCPMARKSWLQRGTAIQNPYYGKAMPDCGRIVPPPAEAR